MTSARLYPCAMLDDRFGGVPGELRDASYASVLGQLDVESGGAVVTENCGTSTAVHFHSQ